MGLQVFFIFFLVQRNVLVNEANENPRARLLRALLKNNSYILTRDVIPLPTTNNNVINVNLQFDVHQILELNEKKQVVMLNVWLYMKWKNIFLQWNPSDYNGVKKITVDKDKIWVPDLTLWNRAVNDASIYHRIDTRIVVDHNGNCVWTGPVTTTSTCAIRVKYFPFDNQTCVLNFGSWRHSIDELVFTPCKTTCSQKKYFKPNSEWSLDNIHGAVENVTFDSGNFGVVRCRLEVSRKSVFYIMNMVVPNTIIAFLCCLTFYLPANNGERASLVITVLLAMTVYMLIVAESMPPTSEALPLVQKFYLVTIIETAFCLFATCVVVRWHENTAPMPDWVYLVFNCFLRKVLNVKYIDKKLERKDSRSISPERRNETRCVTRPPSRKSSDTSDVFSLRHYSYTIPETVPDVAVPIRPEGGTTSPEESSPNGTAEVPRDWKLAARILNQVFLIAFSLIFALSIAAMFALK